MARSSHALLCWRRAVSMAWRKQSSAAATWSGDSASSNSPLETVQLGLLAALVVFLGDGQALVERLASVLEPACLRVGIAQGAELKRKGQLGTAGPESIEALPEQWQSFFRAHLAAAVRHP